MAVQTIETFAIGLQTTEFSTSSRSNLPLKTSPTASLTFAITLQIDDINTSDRRDAFVAQGIYGETPTGGSGQFWS